MDKQWLDGMWDHMRQKYGIYLRVLDAIPADQFGDHPVSGMRTPTQMAVHTSGSIVRDIAEGVSSGTITADEAGEDAVADEHLAGGVGNPWGIPLNSAFAMVVLNDEFLHHRGQLYAYVRAGGAEPPCMWGFEANPAGFQPRG